MKRTIFIVLCCLAVVFSDGLLNRFLAACKEDGMPQIDYRAVVTEHNIHWNVLDLYQELVQEHESLHGGNGQL